MRANKASKSFSPDLYVVETQKTRGGIKKATGIATRPYRFGEFDVLAVSMYPSTQRWDAFMYTVAVWLLPSPADPTHLMKLQPVSATPNDDWTNSFHAVVKWLRSGARKTINK